MAMLTLHLCDIAGLVCRLDCSGIPCCKCREMIGPQNVGLYNRARPARVNLEDHATDRHGGVFCGACGAVPGKGRRPPNCAAAPQVLWGDGEHDDTAALNAWFRGETVIWAQTHAPVGPEIADRTFLLSSTVYVSGGTGRNSSGSA